MADIHDDRVSSSSYSSSCSSTSSSTSASSRSFPHTLEEPPPNNRDIICDLNLTKTGFLLRRWLPRIPLKNLDTMNLALGGSGFLGTPSR